MIILGGVLFLLFLYMSEIPLTIPLLLAVLLDYRMFLANFAWLYEYFVVPMNNSCAFLRLLVFISHACPKGCMV